MRCRPILPYSAPPQFDQSHNSIAHTRWSDTPEAIKSGTNQGDQMELGNGGFSTENGELVLVKPSILEPMHHSFQAGPPCIGLISISPPSRWKTDEVVDWGWWVEIRIGFRWRWVYHHIPSYGVVTRQAPEHFLRHNLGSCSVWKPWKLEKKT